MKKCLAALVAVLCLTFFAGNMVSQAAPTGHCGTCNAVSIQHGEHLTNYTEAHTVTVKGEQVTCYKTFSLDRTYYTCPNGHGTTYVDIPTLLSHSINH